MKQTKIIILISAVAVLAVGIFLINLYTGNKIEPDKENVSEQNETNVDNTGTGIPSPGGAYCRMLGYKTRNTEQRGFCIFPDGSECEVWDFYAGLCGQEWSYCKLHGYELISGDVESGRCKYASATICSVCINKTTGAEATIEDLMNITKSLGSSIPSSTLLI